jgi:type I restriction enzyme M protein
VGCYRRKANQSHFSSNLIPLGYTGIKTNILFFTKGEPTKDVWFYEHPYPDGVTSYNKGKPMRFEEFQTEINWWGDEAEGFKARKQTKQAWKRSVSISNSGGSTLTIRTRSRR